MTPEQKVLVQQSFAKVVPIADVAAALFYGKLFELDPELKDLFPEDLTEQGKKLMQVIGVAVKGLDKLDELVPVVEQLGIRHVNYGVKEDDYDTVGTALIWTLGQGLGDDFTPEVKDAWVTVYGILSSVMKTAAAKAA